jgi:hypothetical protein
MNYKDLSRLISLFKKYQYEIIIKLHPSYKGNLKKEFLSDRNIKILNDPNTPALKLMLEEKPSFVAGWNSTTLCEADLHGITTICLSNPADLKYSPHQFHKRSIGLVESSKRLDEYLANSIDAFEILK